MQLIVQSSSEQKEAELAVPERIFQFTAQISDLPQTYAHQACEDGGMSLLSLINEKNSVVLNALATSFKMSESSLKLFIVKGEKLAYGCLSFFDTVNGQKIKTIEFSPDGQLIAVGLVNGARVLLKAIDFTIILGDGINGQKISFIVFSQNSQFVACKLTDGSYAICRVVCPDKVFTLAPPSKEHTIYDFCFSPDSQLIGFIVSPERHIIKNGIINSIILSPVNNSCILRSAVQLDKDLIRIQRATHVAFSPDSRLVACKLTGGSCVIYQSACFDKGFTLIPTINGHGIHNFSFSPDGKFIAFWLMDGSWVLRSTDQLSKNISINEKVLIGVVFSPNGQFIGFRLVDNSCVLRSTAQLDKDLACISRTINLTFSSDGQFVAFWLTDGSCTLRAIREINREVIPYNQINGQSMRDIIFSPDGKFIAFWLMDGSWVLRSTDQLDKDLIPSNKINGQKIKTIEFSSDGKLVAFKLADGAHVLLRAIDFTTILGDRINGQKISAICFSSDSQLLSVVLADGGKVLCSFSSVFSQASVRHVLLAAICEELAKTVEGNAVLAKLKSDIEMCFNFQRVPQPLRNFVLGLVPHPEFHSASASAAAVH